MQEGKPQRDPEEQQRQVTRFDMALLDEVITEQARVAPEAGALK